MPIERRAANPVLGQEEPLCRSTALLSGETCIAAAIVATAVLGSWTWEPTRAIWNGLDVGVFRATNSFLVASPAWRTICAGANTRLFDCVALAATVCLLVHTRRSQRLRREIISVIVLMVVLVCIKTAFADWAVGNWCGYRRASPTLTLDALRISASEDWIETKDSSSYCFPSDHGMVVLTIALYAILQSPKKWGWAIAYAVIFAAPRVLSGAHWATDILIGSGFVAVASLLAHSSIMRVAQPRPASAAADSAPHRRAA